MRRRRRTGDRWWKGCCWSIHTTAVRRAFVGEASPIWRDDGDNGQDQADSRQSLSQSGHSQIALLHLLILGRSTSDTKHRVVKHTHTHTIHNRTMDFVPKNKCGVFFVTRREKKPLGLLDRFCRHVISQRLVTLFVPVHERSQC